MQLKTNQTENGRHARIPTAESLHFPLIAPSGSLSSSISSVFSVVILTTPESASEEKRRTWRRETHTRARDPGRVPPGHRTLHPLPAGRQSRLHRAGSRPSPSKMPRWFQQSRYSFHLPVLAAHRPGGTYSRLTLTPLHRGQRAAARASMGD